MTVRIRLLIAAIGLILGLGQAAVAQDPAMDDPRLGQAAGASSSVRLDPPVIEAPMPAPIPEGGMQVTRMRSGDPDASSSVRLDDPAGAGTAGAATLQDVLSRQPPDRASGTALMRQMLTGTTAPLPSAAELDPAAPPSAANPEATLLGPLAARGDTSDAQTWREIRANRADATTQVRGPATTVLIQDGGMAWQAFREGPLPIWGGWLLIGTLAALLLFFVLRGRIMIEGGRTGITIQRFAFVERFGHWLTAGSFILLAVTGLISLFGRVALIPLFGLQVFSPIATASKWVHNNVAWAFMAGLVLIFVMWVAHNLPSRLDLQWIAKGGGLFTRDTHVHARKFNFGQKVVFWAVAILGLSISLSGLSLLLPTELHLFGDTFGFLNDIGLPQALGLGPLPVEMSPQREMQLAQAWHAIIAFVFMAIILGHIYIGSIGMEGAFDAMGTGQVDVQWAREHHDLWYEEVTGRDPEMASSGHRQPGRS